MKVSIFQCEQPRFAARPARHLAAWTTTTLATSTSTAATARPTCGPMPDPFFLQKRPVAEEISLVAMATDARRGLFAMSRAMGGYSGRLAADVALERFMGCLRKGEPSLEQAALEAHEAVLQAIAEAPQLWTGTSTCLAALRISGDTVHVVHAGDCQVWAIEARRQEAGLGVLRRLTQPHVLGVTHPGVLPDLPVVTSTLGSPDQEPQLTTSRFPHVPQTVYLLTSDAVREQDLLAVVRDFDGPVTGLVLEVLAQRLFDRRLRDSDSKEIPRREWLERTLGVLALKFDD